VNFKRLVMFKLLQEVCELQGPGLILSVRSLEFVTDEVPEQAVVSSFFFRRLKILLSTMFSLFTIARNQERDSAKLSRGLSVAIEARTVQPTELPISEAVVSIIRHCDVSATPHQITLLNREEVPQLLKRKESLWSSLSALGQKRTFRPRNPMSALRPKANIPSCRGQPSRQCVSTMKSVSFPVSLLMP
jgi:hypothetical protein